MPLRQKALRDWTLQALLALALVCHAGCAGKRAWRERQAFEAGQASALREAGAARSGIQVRGEVRHPVIAWREGLTLAQAIHEAGFTGTRNPRFIRLRNGDEWVDIPADELLSGRVNPPLEPGDVIELIR